MRRDASSRTQPHFWPDPSEPVKPEQPAVVLNPPPEPMWVKGKGIYGIAVWLSNVSPGSLLLSVRCMSGGWPPAPPEGSSDCRCKRCRSAPNSPEGERTISLYIHRTPHGYNYQHTSDWKERFFLVACYTHQSISEGQSKI